MGQGEFLFPDRDAIPPEKPTEGRGQTPTDQPDAAADKPTELPDSAAQPSTDRPNSTAQKPANRPDAAAKKKASTRSSRAKAAPTPYSVTQLTRLIKLTLSQHLPAKVIVQGEISNLKQPSSGHLYLTLKDENSQIPCVMWRTAAGRLKFQLADGQAVLATGRLDVFEPHGKYQLYLDKLEPTGVGALELAFRQLAEKLSKEGLFDESHKKPLPYLPRTIAIVTSGTGAAIEDITNTLGRRFPSVRKLLYPVAVQGDAAPAEIANAITQLNRRAKESGGIDLMIVGRGGGSIEDLWAFNEEIVARAIFASSIPVITGVGHEIDTTIADFVADRRAATPTAAAELAVPVLEELLEDIDQIGQRLTRAISQYSANAKQSLDTLAGRPFFARPSDIVHMPQQLLDEQTARLKHTMLDRLHRSARCLEEHAAGLRAIEPRATLAHGQAALAEHRQLLQVALQHYCQSYQHKLANVDVRLRAASPSRQTSQQRTLLTHQGDRLGRAIQQLHWHREQQLQNCLSRLENLNPRAVLQRGYSITRLQNTNRIVTADATPSPGDMLITELAGKTTVESKVTATKPKPSD